LRAQTANGFGSSKRGPLSQCDKDIPGPGTYTGGNSLGGPNFGFGSSTRAKGGDPLGASKEAPGPGNYNLGGQFGRDAPKASMKYRPASASAAKQASEMPGPGQYTPNADQIKGAIGSLGGKMGTSKRSDEPGKSDAPGPGNYNLGSSLRDSHSYGFGTGKRSDLYGRNGAPGPGNYTVADSKGGAPSVRKQHFTL